MFNFCSISFRKRILVIANSCKSTKPSNQVKDQENAFKNAMREYESSAKAKYRTGFDPEKTHRMEDLERVLEESIKNREQRDARGGWDKIYDAFLKLGKNKDNINGWLGLLPSESEYFSVLCGGFKIILEVSLNFPLTPLFGIDHAKRPPLGFGTWMKRSSTACNRSPQSSTAPSAF